MEWTKTKNKVEEEEKLKKSKPAGADTNKASIVPANTADGAADQAKVNDKGAGGTAILATEIMSKEEAARINQGLARRKQRLALEAVVAAHLQTPRCCSGGGTLCTCKPPCGSAGASIPFSAQAATRGPYLPYRPPQQLHHNHHGLYIQQQGLCPRVPGVAAVQLMGYAPQQHLLYPTHAARSPWPAVTAAALQQLQQRLAGSSFYPAHTNKGAPFNAPAEVVVQPPPQKHKPKKHNRRPLRHGSAGQAPAF